VSDRSPTGPVRVMIVDDHALVRAAVRAAITAPDVELVAEVATAEDALLVAPQVRPDVLLVDINLPGMDGLRLVRELAPRLPSTRIVMLTASSDDADLLDAMRHGAIGYLTKDVTPEAIHRSILSAARGELAMSRATGARLVQGLIHSSRHGAAAEDDHLSSLTDREMEILRLLVRGMTDREIAETLTISPRTVGAHVGAILRKLGARNRAEAVARYPRSP
jgi:DNA-binding NarL/FixJ family response regulator